MFGKKPPQVLVAGAGPVGLLAALALARRGVRVQIVDKEWRTGTHSYALALHARTLALLEQAGVLGDVLEKAYRVRSLGLYDGRERQAELRLQDLADDFSFVAAMRQADLERLLEEALAKQGVKVLWNHEVSAVEAHDDRVSVRIDKLDRDSCGYAVAHGEWVVTKSKSLDVPFVIGADGHRSAVRRALGIAFPEVGEASDFAVFEFQTDADLGHEMRVVLGADAASVCWPLPGGYCRWSFEIPRDVEEPEERRKDRTFGQLADTYYPVLEQRHLEQLLAQRAPWFAGKAEEARWRMVVRFERRLAERFGQGRAWLAGDAGHLTGPAGVQSMNVGLREAWQLGGTIADVLEGRAGTAELEAYDSARRAEWQQLLGLDGGLVATEAASPWVRARGRRLLSCLPASGEDLARLAGQVGLGF